MSSATIQIKIGAVELTCNGEVDCEQLEKVLGSLKNSLPELVAAASGTEKRTVTAEELLSASSAKTHGEKAGVVAYWLETHNGRKDWRTGDIVDVLRNAGESVPANMTDTLNRKQEQDLFEVTDRRWKLTGEGRGWVKYRLLNQTDE